MFGIETLNLIAIATQKMAVLGGGFDLPGLMQAALLWVKDLGTAGAIAYIVTYIVATVLFLPGSLITLGGGAIFGVGWGFLYVFTGATLGSTLAFLVGRYLARGWVEKRIEGNLKFRAIDAAVAREGLKIVLLTRLSPVFPFNLLNYAFGITQVSLKDYVVGALGMLPGTLLYVYMGSLAGDLAQIGTATANPQTQIAQWGVRIIGFIATLAATLYITRIAKKALSESIEN